MDKEKCMNDINAKHIAVALLALAAIVAALISLGWVTEKACISLSSYELVRIFWLENSAIEAMSDKVPALIRYFVFGGFGLFYLLLIGVTIRMLLLSLRRFGLFYLLVIGAIIPMLLSFLRWLSAIGKAIIEKFQSEPVPSATSESPKS